MYVCNWRIYYNVDVYYVSFLSQFEGVFHNSRHLLKPKVKAGIVVPHNWLV